MAQIYATVLTDVGAAKLARAQMNGQSLKWSEMALGDGGGAPVAVVNGRAALVNEVYRAPINYLHADPDDDTQVVAEMVVDPEIGGWTVREVGIFDDDGDLVVYGSYPDIVKSVAASGSAVTLTTVCRAQVGSAASVTLKIDPGYVYVMKKEFDRALLPLFKGVEAGGRALHATPEHPNLRLAAELPVYFEADESAGKITAKVRASVAAAAGMMPIADATELLAPGWGALPPGWVGFFAAEAAPDGFLICNGAQNLSRVTYARLFGAVGTRYGAGDGATTFGIPDLRGKFLRGYLAGVTEALGTPQSDAIRNIVGAFTLRSTTSGVWPNIVASARGAFVLSSGAWTANTVTVSTATGDGRVVAFDASKNVPTAAENRPANVALLPCIKY